jgi:hypothetical protein
MNHTVASFNSAHEHERAGVARKVHDPKNLVGWIAAMPCPERITEQDPDDIAVTRNGKR